MKRYTFRQNNSGGYWAGPHYFVCLALDEQNAWNILKSQDWYTDAFCKCCGPRWERSWDWESDPSSDNEALEYLDYRDKKEVIDLTVDWDFDCDFPYDDCPYGDNGDSSEAV